MSSLIKFSHYSKRILRPVQLIRCHISTSKKSQEVCVTNAEIAEQEPVIFLIKNCNLKKMLFLINLYLLHRI